ncbi:MAG: arginase [Vicinamibacterales bacterium]
MRPVHLIGVPLDLGGGRRGVDMGPSAMRIAGLGERVLALGRAVVDCGDIDAPIPESRVPGDSRKRYIADIAAVCESLRARCEDVLSTDGVPVVLGGDHSVAAGSVAATAAYARRHGRPLGLLWIDAHGDMNTPESSPTGNVHGMPLAAILGREPAELRELGGFFPKVSPQHTALIGVRNLDIREKALVRESGIHVFTMKDIDRLGMATVAERALDITMQGTAGIHVSFDVDVCDPTIAPGVGTPVRGGLDYRESHLLMEMICDASALLALDIVEVNPVVDTQNSTAILSTELALSALGLQILS